MLKSPRNIILLPLIIIATVVFSSLKNPDRAPVADELTYINLAYSLYAHGVYGFSSHPDVAPEPNGAVGPFYPAFLAAMMHIDPTLPPKLRCHRLRHITQDKRPCDSNFGVVKWVQLAFAGLGMVAVWLIAKTISQRTGVAGLAVVLCLASGEPTKFANHFLTEAIYLPLSIVFLALCVWAMRNPRALPFAVVGAVLACIALTRPSFYYFFFLSFPLIVIAAKIQPSLRNETLVQAFKALGIPLLTYALVFGVLTGSWIARNAQVIGVSSISVGYSARTLATRLSYNEMTAREYAAGWLYWFPDFGDKAAIFVFGEETIERLRFESPRGFYGFGTTQVMNEVQAETQTTASFLSSKEGGVQTSWLINEKIIRDLPVHIATTLLMAWRGVFIGKYFGVLGLISIMLFIARPPTPYPHNLALLIALGLLMLGFNAFFTLNIPRYNLFLMMPMSIASAWALARGTDFLRAKTGIAFKKQP